MNNILVSYQSREEPNFTGSDLIQHSVRASEPFCMKCIQVRDDSIIRRNEKTFSEMLAIHEVQYNQVYRAKTQLQ